MAVSWVSKNDVFNKIADMQNVEVGSSNGPTSWVEGGLLPYSGAAGQHPGYGWNLNNKLNKYGQPWVRAVLANYGHRQAFYEQAPMRNGGYYIGSRPLDWSCADEMDPNDNCFDPVYKGEHYYFPKSMGPAVGVSGPDAEHFPMRGLFAVARSSTGAQQFQVASVGDLRDAAALAKVMFGYLVACNVGMFRKSNGLPQDFSSHRQLHWLLNNTLDAQVLGVLSPSDGVLVASHLNTKVLPILKAAPGDNAGGKGGEQQPTKAFIQWYNGPAWSMPSLYDAYLVQPNGTLKNDLASVIERYSQYMLDFHLKAPGYGHGVETVFYDKTSDAALGVGGNPANPVPSLAPFITAADALQYDFSTSTPFWNIRAQHVAATWLGDAGLLAANAAAVNTLKSYGTDVQKSFLVGANGNFLF